jgi:hypothetical protein
MERAVSIFFGIRGNDEAATAANTSLTRRLERLETSLLPVASRS